MFTPNTEVIPESDFMSDNNGLHMFWGDGEIDVENALDFVNSSERSFFAKVNLIEMDIIHTFQLWLKLGIAAKIQWNELAVGEKDTWASLQIAFENKLPEKLYLQFEWQCHKMGKLP